MPPGADRTVLILRRMMRKSLGIWAWSAYDPTKAQPGELKFELFDGNDRRIGELAYTSFELKLLSPKRVTMTTPWGIAEIDITGSSPRISLNGHELAQLKGSLLKRGFELVFSEGKSIRFMPLKDGKNDIEFSDGNGSLIGVEEKGVLSDDEAARRIQPTPEEIKMLPKNERPRSVESRNYRQFRVKVAGVLPVKEDDVARTLCIFVSFAMLVDEIPKG